MKLSIKLHEHEGKYIANCPELDVNCYGTDRSQAVRRLKNVLQFYISSALEFGLEVERFDEIAVDGEVERESSIPQSMQTSKTIN
jgi:predicted RNase H-like HicB family nuclease